MSSTNPAALPQGAVFQGRYQVVRCIKAGGMGAVYECIHLTTQKRRALKVMLPQVVAAKGMRERFELEARVTAAIDSNHIVETFDAGIDHETGAPFLVMELLNGDDLDALLDRHGPFTTAEAVVLLSQVALALDRTHGAGIVHRDLKPQNLFLTTRDDGSPCLKVLDFGIAKVVADGNETAQQTAAIGTPLYMSPEQATGDGHIGPAADLYALGHIAYTLLAGISYWAEEQQSLPMYAFMSRSIAGAKEPPSVRAARRGVTIPHAFDAWFLKATTRDAASRFDRASTQIIELAHALGITVPRQLLAAPQSMRARLSGAGDAQTARVGATPVGASSPEAIDSSAFLAVSSAAIASGPIAPTADVVAAAPPAEAPRAITGGTISPVLQPTSVPNPASRGVGLVIALGVTALVAATLGGMVVARSNGAKGAPAATQLASGSSVGGALSAVTASATALATALETAPAATAAPTAAASVSPDPVVVPPPNPTIQRNGTKAPRPSAPPAPSQTAAPAASATGGCHVVTEYDAQGEPHFKKVCN